MDMLNFNSIKKFLMSVEGWNKLWYICTLYYAAVKRVS